MFTKYRFLLTIALLMFISCAHPGVDVTLYDVSVPVSSQSVYEKDHVMAEGLAKVSMKLTEDARLEQNEVFIAAQKHASDYVQQFQYLTDASGQLRLSMHFDKSSIIKLLKQANLAIWTEDRPLTIMWIAFSEAGQSRLVGEDDASGLVAAILEQGEQRGLPVIVPQMDLNTLATVSVADVWRADVRKLGKSSVKYHPNALLMARVTKTEAGYDSRWQLDMGDSNQTWELSADSEDALATDLIDRLVGYYVSLLSIHNESNRSVSSITIMVNNIGNLNLYSQVTDYLGAMAMVKHVMVKGVRPGELVLELSLVSERQSFLDAISLDNRMMVDGADDADSSVDLAFAWRQ